MLLCTGGQCGHTGGKGGRKKEIGRRRSEEEEREGGRDEGREHFKSPFVRTGREAFHTVMTKAFLQPSTAATTCCHPEGCTHPHPTLSHPICSQCKQSHSALCSADVSKRDPFTVLPAKRVHFTLSHLNSVHKII